MPESDQVQKAYTTILKHLVDTGRAPHHTELAKTPDTTVAHFNVPLTKWRDVNSSFN